MRKFLNRTISIFVILSLLTVSFGSISAKNQSKSNTHTIIKWTATDGISTYNYKYSPSLSKTTTLKPAYIPNFQTSSMANNTDARTTNHTQINADNYPYCAVGLICAYFDTNGDGFFETQSETSAFLEAEDIILTAAHCVFDTEHDVWGENIVFFPGMDSLNDSTSIDDMANVISVSIGQNYADHTEWNEHNDWAICQIDKNLGDSYGWFGMSYEPQINMQLKLSGYPRNFNYYQYLSNGTLYNLENEMNINYTNYCVPGYSGGPVYNNSVIAFGIHTYDGGVSSGGGTYFVDWLFNLIVEECDASAERWQ